MTIKNNEETLYRTKTIRLLLVSHKTTPQKTSSVVESQETDKYLCVANKSCDYIVPDHLSIFDLQKILSFTLDKALRGGLVSESSINPNIFESQASVEDTLKYWRDTNHSLPSHFDTNDLHKEFFVAHTNTELKKYGIRERILSFCQENEAPAVNFYVLDNNPETKRLFKDESNSKIVKEYYNWYIPHISKDEISNFIINTEINNESLYI